MKRKLAVLTAAMTALAMAGCGASQETATTTAETKDNQAAGDTSAEESSSGAEDGSEVSGSVMLYTSSSDDYMTDIASMFQEKYPNISFEYYRSGTEEVVSKIMTEEKSSGVQCDVIMLADTPTFEMLKENGLLMQYDYPEIDQMYEDFVDPDHMYYGTAVGSTGIIYNTDMVTEAPTSLTVFTDPANKGNCVMPSPLYSGTAAYNLGVYTRMEDLGWDFYQDMKDNEMQVVNGNGGVIDAVANGEKAYGMVLDTDSYVAINNGSPIAFVYPEEGCSSICDPIALVNGTENEEAAKIFMDFMLSKEVREFAAENYFKTAPRKDVEPVAGMPSIAERKILSSDPKELYATKEDDKAKFDQMYNQ